MPGRPTLDAKLEAADEWVRDNFNHLSDFLVAMGCEFRDVTAPGRSFRLSGGPLVHLHPKQSYIGIGLPRSMEVDLEGLSAYPRRGAGPGWFRYEPDNVDGDTVEFLLSSAVTRQASASARRASAPPVQASASTAQVDPPSTAPDDRSLSAASDRVPVHASSDQDEADLQLIWSILRSYDAHKQAVRSPRPVRIIREVLFFVWEAPRLPRGGKRSRFLPHSPAARAQRLAGDDSGLVYEHVMPISLVIKDLLGDPPADTEALRARLDATADRVIILKQEDRALDAAGFRNVMPDPGDPWSRYAALGLTASDFREL